MKICITSTGTDLDAQIDPRFGRCPYFLFINTDDMNVEAVPNQSALATGGAGIQAAQKVAQQKATCVITGNIGPNAFQTLQAANIEVITGVNGRVKDAVEQFKAGTLKKTERATVGSHFGIDDKKAANGGKPQ
jgi:predicted Fe-Mo cluster-binding NifX family protein